MILVVRVRSEAKGLTESEKAVVQQAINGQSNKQIGVTLGLAASTVSAHLRAAMDKLACEHRSQLVSFKAAQGLCVPTTAGKDD